MLQTINNMKNHLINPNGKLKFMQIHLGNPFKRKPTQINFPMLAVGFSLFGAWNFCFLRGIDNKWMTANPYINQYGIEFTPDTKWCKFGQSYHEMGWGVYWHSKK